MNNLFPLLAIETSDSICGACVYFDENKFFSSKLILKHSHAEKLFEVINSVLAMASITQSELKSIAVSNGPASFTGLRIGMSAAKGIAQALSIPIIPVPTFEALALQISSFLSDRTEFIISNKVGRDELYFAKFQIMGNNYIFSEELKIVPIFVQSSIPKEILIFGNAFNSGANDTNNLRNISAPDPEFIAKWAVTFGIDKMTTDIDFLEPNYIKDFIVKEKKMIRNIVILFIISAMYIFPQLISPKVGVQQLNHDFGNINQGDVVNHSFVIANNGGDLLKINDVKASCGCTAASPDKKELKPGESTNIVVSFNSKGRKGPQTKTVTVTTNDPEKPQVTLTITCNIIESKVSESKTGAKIFFPETQHDFGKVQEGKKVEYTFKFENKGTESLVIKDVKTSCGCTAAVVSNKTIKPGEVGSIKVDFDTKSRQGRNSKSITVVSNDTKEPNKVITIYADVQKN